MTPFDHGNYAFVLALRNADHSLIPLLELMCCINSAVYRADQSRLLWRSAKLHPSSYHFSQARAIRLKLFFFPLAPLYAFKTLVFNTLAAGDSKTKQCFAVFRLRMVLYLDQIFTKRTKSCSIDVLHC